ncbi:hypothetical protein [Bacillus sp. S14(2024)]|uniref:hypothetical protein n=1 Tax=Bacillus sp. S14(2024) TaxID=3162884 RepID=UPI003D20ADFD
MGRILLVLSTVLSFIVSILNFIDQRYINGIFMAVIFVSVLIALITELRNKTKG